MSALHNGIKGPKQLINSKMYVTFFLNNVLILKYDTVLYVYKIHLTSTWHVALTKMDTSSHNGDDDDSSRELGLEMSKFYLICILLF